MMASDTHGTPGAIPFTEKLGEQLVAGGRRRLGAEARRRRAVNGAVATTAMAALVMGTVALWPGSSTMDAAAADTLRRAGIAAQQETGDDGPAAGEYRYERWTFQGLIDGDGGVSLGASSVNEAWTGRDGLGAIVVRDSDVGPEGHADFAELFGTPDPTEIAPGFLEEVGEPEGETAPPGPPPTTAAVDEPVEEPAGGIVTAVGSGGYFTGRESVELEEFRRQVPTDPARLRAYLVDIVDDNRSIFAVFGIGEPPVENALFNLAWDMLDDRLPSEYRAALFEVLAGIEGVTQTEGTDQLARPAVTVGMPDPTGEVRFELLFDPGSGAYVGERTVLLRENGEFYPGMRPGAVISENLLVETAVVDQIGQRP